MRRGLMVLDGWGLFSALAAAVFVLALLGRWLVYVVVRSRLWEASTYQGLTDLMAAYRVWSWVLVAVAVSAAALAAVSVGVCLVRGGMSAGIGPVVWWWAVAGFAFVGYVGWLVGRSGQEAQGGLSALRPAGARPSSDFVVASVERLAQWPVPVVGGVGVLLAVVWLVAHVRVVREVSVRLGRGPV